MTIMISCIHGNKMIFLLVWLQITTWKTTLCSWYAVDFLPHFACAKRRNFRVPCLITSTHIHSYIHTPTVQWQCHFELICVRLWFDGSIVRFIGFENENESEKERERRHNFQRIYVKLPLKLAMPFPCHIITVADVEGVKSRAKL